MQTTLFTSTCCEPRRGVFAALSRAMAKGAGARLRNAGLLPTRLDWSARAAVCERCPLRVVQCGKSYCGRPFLRQTVRDPVTDGCGCPMHAKAKDPAEHCPIDARHHAADRTGARCTCKWCAIAA